MRPVDFKRAAVDLVVRELGEGRTVRLPVSSTSMAPVINAGDLIKVEPVSGRLKCGDIVVIGRDEDWIVHRLLGVLTLGGRQQVVTRGDSAHRCDTPFGVDSVLGRVTGIVREGREESISCNWRCVLQAWLGWQVFRLRKAGGRIVGVVSRRANKDLRT